MSVEKATLSNFEIKNQNVVIKRSSDAPLEVKQNPFYDPEWWGRAKSFDDIYLPDSDEALSFAIAAHELGHLVKEGESDSASLYDFESTRLEEQKAWEKGMPYLEKYIEEYYNGNIEMVDKIQKAFEKIKDLMMEAVILSKEMYLTQAEFDDPDNEEYQKILKQKREEFYDKKSSEYKVIFDQIEGEKLGVKPDWPLFSAAVTKAVEDISKDNEKRSAVGLADFDKEYFYSISQDGKDEWIAIGMENCKNQRYYTVVDENNVKLGVVGVYDTEDDQNITHVIIEQKFRGKGFLPKFYEQLMQKENLSFLTATIDVKNIASIKAHEKNGFEKVSDKEYEEQFHKYKYRYIRK